METSPVRIKAYGLMGFTRAGYIRVQAVVLVASVLLLLFALLWQPTGPWANPIFLYLEWWVLLVLIGEVGETIVMLRKFREKERRLEHPSRVER